MIPYYLRKAIAIGKDGKTGFDLDEAAIQELAKSTDGDNDNYVDYNFESMPRLRDTGEGWNGESNEE